MLYLHSYVDSMAIVSSQQEDKQPLDTGNSVLKPYPNKSDLEYEEGPKDKNLRPTSFDSYIGQSNLLNTLKISISAAQKRKDLASMGHILLYGPPGLGKTSLAYLLANELGTEAKIFSAPALDRPKDILGILMSINDGDIVFIDEIHRLNKITEELLYPALEDYQVDLTSGKDASSRAMRININKFILVGATTKLGFISAPLRDRFIHIHRMEYYKKEELAAIAMQNSKLLNIDIDQAGSLALAARSRGTPRIVNRLLRLVRDYAHHKNLDSLNETRTNEALDLYRIDKAGLDHMDRKILQLMIEKYKGGPVGLETLAALSGEDKTTIEDYYEPFLLQSGFLLRTQRGRMVTELGFQYMSNTK